MKKTEEKARKRLKRKLRIRGRIFGTSECPRLSIFRSNRHIYAQVIDDEKGHTLVSVSDLEKDLRDTDITVEGVKKLGEVIGSRLKQKNITSIVFDRNGFKYHGVVKSFADSVRATGIQF
jgi:large subunit ribosomal protein L18